MSRRTPKISRQADASHPIRRPTAALSRLRPQPLVLAVQLALLGGVAATTGWCAPAQAQGIATPAPASPPIGQEATRRYDIPAGPLGTVLTRFVGESGALLAGSSELVQGRHSPGLQGTYAPHAAIEALLTGTGLDAVHQANGTYVLRLASPAARKEGSVDERLLPVVSVTASRTLPGDLPKPYAGGQVTRNGRLGLLGDKDVMDMPFNLSSYTSELIQNQQAATLADLLDNDPAVRTSSRGRNTSVGGGDNFFIRGFTLANRDISLNGLYGIVPYGSLSLETMERVEVLKGPGALLNGMAPSGGVGGAINVVPKRATDAPITRLTASYASDSQLGSHIDIGRRWGNDNEFGARINALYRQGDTAIDGQTARLVAGAIGLDYRGERLRVSLDAGRQTDNVQAASVGYDFDSTLSAIPSPPKAGSRYAQDWEQRKFRDNYAALHAEFDASNAWTLYAAAGGRQHRHTNFRGRSSIVDAQGGLVVMPEHYPEASKSTSFLVGSRFKFDALTARHEVNVAASSLKTDASLAYAWWDTADSSLQNPVVIARPGPANADPGGFFDMRKSYDRKTSSLGISDTLSWLNGNLQLTIGLRHQQIFQDNRDPWSEDNPFTTGYKRSVNSPAIGVVVKPWQNTSLYANHIEGLSPGATAPADAVNAGDVFPPVKTKQTEVGAKVDLGRVMTTLALFELTQPNAVSAPVTGGAPSDYRYTMDGEQRNRGVELNAVGELAQGLRFIGGTTFMQAKQVRTQDGANDGKNAVAVPRWIANAGLDWDVPFLSGLALSTRVLVTRPQYMNATNTLRLPGWTRWDIGTRYQTKALAHPLTLRANVLNVANRSYWESSGGSAGILLGAPRTLNLSATIDF